jgi:hypothetical protein
MRPSTSAIAHNTASTAPAAPSVWPVAPLVDEHGTPSPNTAITALPSALSLAGELAGARWLQYSAGEGNIQVSFLATLIFWLAVVFLSYGVVAPRNQVSFWTMFIVALSLSMAINLTLDLDTPNRGLIQISGAPLQLALEQKQQHLLLPLQLLGQVLPGLSTKPPVAPPPWPFSSSHSLQSQLQEPACVSCLPLARLMTTMMVLPMLLPPSGLSPSSSPQGQALQEGSP